RMLLVLSLVGALVLGAIALGPAGAARRPRHVTAHVKLRLPAPDGSQVTLVTVKATAPKGQKVGSLKVRTTNESQLPNISAVYLTQAPRKHSRVTTFKVFLVVRRFLGGAAIRPGSAAAATTEELDVAIDVEAARFHIGPISPNHATCDMLRGWDGLFES